MTDHDRLAIVDGRHPRRGNRRQGCRFIPISHITSLECTASRSRCGDSPWNVVVARPGGAPAGHDIQTLENYYQLGAW